VRLLKEGAVVVVIPPSLHRHNHAGRPLRAVSL